jgi:deoxycytidine triphosphate deaminase
MSTKIYSPIEENPRVLLGHNEPRVLWNDNEEEVIAKFDQFKSLDPFPDITPSLLNSADIHDYIITTGMISPYHPELLKPATYGVKLSGEYIYWESKDTPIQGRFEDLSEKDEDGDIVFNLKSNTIVYVSLEPYFRLPDYIAARFNLKISHIHKGLLLGTGQIVDPGFDGKLCVPVHNLTRNDYKIKVSKTFIWMEFTKLSSNVNWIANSSQSRVGEYRKYNDDGKKGRNIRDYIHNAYPNGSIYSSVANFIENTTSVLEDSQKVIEESKSVNKTFQFGVLISIGGAALACLSVVVASFMMHYKLVEAIQVNEQQKNDTGVIIKQYQDDINKLNLKVTELDKALIELKNNPPRR